jgi:hypothetical protein
MSFCLGAVWRVIDARGPMNPKEHVSQHVDHRPLAQNKAPQLDYFVRRGGTHGFSPSAATVCLRANR